MLGNTDSVDGPLHALCSRIIDVLSAICCRSDRCCVWWWVLLYSVIIDTNRGEWEESGTYKIILCNLVIQHPEVLSQFLFSPNSGERFTGRFAWLRAAECGTILIIKGKKFGDFCHHWKPIVLIYTSHIDAQERLQPKPCSTAVVHDNQAESFTDAYQPIEQIIHNEAVWKLWPLSPVTECPWTDSAFLWFIHYAKLFGNFLPNVVYSTAQYLKAQIQAVVLSWDWSSTSHDVASVPRGGV